MSYFEQNKGNFVNELVELLKIPSVSAKSENKADMVRCAEFVKNKLIKIGCNTVEICETAGHPIVYGEIIKDQNLPTILVYGHYDVQPAEPLNLWDSPPFEPVIKDGKIYARGACDDKGQFYMHLLAVECLMAEKKLECNIKFMIEGEEEIGSNNLDLFVKSNHEKLKCDIILISDTAIISNDCPSITVGLRGLSYLEVEVTGPDRDLHSGVYGGAVANPINVLCEMIAKMKDENGHITIPSFYDDIVTLSDEERKELNKAPFELDLYKKSLTIEDVAGEKGYTTVERTAIRPTFDVNGIWGGYTGEGAKTVLPSKAYAKLSMRLVSNQSSEKITRLFTEYFTSIAPKSVKVKVKPHHGGEPAITPTNTFEYQIASEAFEEIWGKKPIPTREGGSIPIVALFEKELKVKTLLMGFGLNSDNIHSPNEHYGLFNFEMGIKTIIKFIEKYKK
jgi:acetylornithine deacetylase/succinyl-diaminopimelate desuccinylase-like protein